MKNKKNHRICFSFFKRWENKSFSVFNSLKKVIIILSLPLIYVALSFEYSQAQTDTINLSGIVVNSQRGTVFSEQTAKIINVINLSQFKAIPSSSISEILDGSLGVDFQNRGAMDVQSDVSIRGGNSDQVLILINGSPINDQQTGHNSFNIPLPLNLIDHIEVLQGPGTQIYGNGAYSGAINIVTKNNSPFYYLSTGYGQDNFYNLNFSFSTKKILFGTSIKHSDGYAVNTDFFDNNIFFRFNFGSRNFRSYVQVSSSIKDFGALNFYTAAFPNQYEKVWKLFTNIHSDFGKNENHRLNLYWNLGYDNFQLFRESDDWYRHINGYFIRNDDDTAKFAPGFYYKGHNFHLANTLGFSYSTFFNSIIGKSVIGCNIQLDSILSNVLGYRRDTVKLSDNIFFNKGDRRFIYNLFLNQTKKFGNFSVSGGANFIYNNNFGAFWTFNGEISYKFLTKNFTYLSISQGVRFPTFTDLFYQSATNEGNPNLKPEKATNYEIGYKYFSNKINIYTALFYCIGTNSIDWVKNSITDAKWKTVNYTLLRTQGLQIAITKKFNSLIVNSISVNYTYLYQDKPDLEVISKYSLNYLRHNFSLMSNFTIVKNLTLNLRFRYFLRNGKYFALDKFNSNVGHLYQSTFTADAKLVFQLKKVSIYANFSNIFNNRYYDLSFIELPGRMIDGGIAINFK